jgi:hypothetical protein
MRQQSFEARRFGLSHAARHACVMTLLALAAAGCGADPGTGAGGAGGTSANGGGGGPGANGGRGGGGNNGTGGATTAGGSGGGGSNGSGGTGAAGGPGTGGAAGAGGAAAGAGGTQATGGGGAGEPGTGGGSGSGGGNAGGSSGGTGSDASAGGEAGTGDTGPAACGMAGQICCAANTCAGGASPNVTTGTGGGMVVLELKANGGNPYQQFAQKNLLPIDGPSSGYITDDGTSFLFVLHQNGAEEIVSSGAQRQRNEVTVNPGNPAIYKGMRNDTMTYTWRFRLERMNAQPTWCDIFQIKQHGPLGVAPYMAFEANKDNLDIDTEKAGVVRSIPLSAIMNVWINATVTLKYADQGSLSILLKKDDGSTVLSYTNNGIDMWDTTVDFVRPKWGLYRNKRDGAGEAAIRYADMKIIRGLPGDPAGCTCR